jgi:hypothetical protein
MESHSADIPEVPNVRPNGRCYCGCGCGCGCGETIKPGKFFVSNHDMKAEARVIRERFGNIASFVAWAETHMPKIEN